LWLASSVRDVRRLSRRPQSCCPPGPEARFDGAPAPNAHVYAAAGAGRLTVIAP